MRRRNEATANLVWLLCHACWPTSKVELVIYTRLKKMLSAGWICCYTTAFAK